MIGTPTGATATVAGELSVETPGVNGRAERRAAAPARSRLVLPAGVFALGLVGLFFLPGHLQYAASSALVMGLIGVALYLPLAALRELPLNSAAIAGLSAYLFAYIASAGGPANHVKGVLIACGVAVGINMLTGLGSLVVTGLYFAVASLVIQVGIEKVVFSIPELTGGAAGRSVAQPEFTGYFNTQRVIFLVAGLVALGCTAGIWALSRRRPLFRAVMAGWAPEGAAAVGLRSWTHKMAIFALSGLLIGIAGCLSAFVNGTPPPPFVFGVIWSVIFLSIPIAAGLRDLSSVWLVAAGFTALPVILESHRINPNLLSGLILLGALLASQGRDRIGATIRRLVGARTVDLDIRDDSDGDRPGRHPIARPAWPALPPGDRPTKVLEGDDLAVVFGGIRAVEGVTVRVEPGRRVGIVGGNGAGKTTTFNALTGFVPLARGGVRLGGHDVTRRPVFARSRAGLGRTFQLPRLADVLTVRQNVLCGHTGHTSAAVAARADALLDRFGLADLADAKVAMVPFGARRKVEIARALVQRPEVMLLDEPASGLEDHEVEELIDALIDLQAAEGWGLLVIEHDLRFVSGIAEYLIVMETGQVLMEGPTEEVLADPRVRRVYLGEVVA